MVYVIGTNKQEYTAALETGQVSVKDELIEKYDIRNINVGDSFYFNINKENLVIGPYKITSKCFIIYNEMHDDENINGGKKTFRCFFENRNSQFQTISIKKAPPFRVENVTDFTNKKDTSFDKNDSSVLIIDESNYIFRFSFVKEGRLWEEEIKLSTGVLRDFLNEKNKAIDYVAMGEDRKALSCLKSATNIISSYFFQRNYNKLQGIKGTLSIFPKNRAWFIPFWWLKILHKNFFANELKGGAVYKVKDVEGFTKGKIDIENAIIICDSTGTVSSAGTEGRKMYSYLESIGIQTDFLAKDLSYIEINNYFEKYDLIHFIGHGERGWRIAKRRILAPEKITLTQKKTKLVVSNSCNTASFEGRENIVSKLLKCGVDFIVASDMKIPDKSFSDFFISFYENIFKSGMSIPLSFSDAVSKNIENEKTDWIFFRLFGQ
jgi:hypothetical protein